MPPMMSSLSKRCSRSRSRIFGATSRAPHSRMLCSSRRCSSVRSKLIMAAGNGTTRHGRAYEARRVREGAVRDGRTALDARSVTVSRAPRASPALCRAAAVDGDLEVIRCCRRARRLRRAPPPHRSPRPRDMSRAGHASRRCAGRARTGRTVPLIDVRDQIAEAIDTQRLRRGSRRRATAGSAMREHVIVGEARAPATSSADALRAAIRRPARIDRALRTCG